MKKLIYLSIFVYLFTFSIFGQQVYNSSYQINQTDSIVLSQVPELKVPELYKGKNPPTLPDIHDNSIWPFLPPSFSQNGYSCGQASTVGYTFTYEINRARNIPGDQPENQYPPDYTWNFFNKGQSNQGVCFYYSYEAIKSNGQPNVTDFGAMSGSYLTWMSGYEKYHNAMFNRLSEINSIYVGDPDGITVLKNWLYDHMEGSQYGGLANFYTDYYFFDHLPENTPEGGKCVVSEWGPGTGHSMTIVGWNDSIRFDYNNDGLYTNDMDINDDNIVDMKDWEIGGFKFVNSFGPLWADSSFCYMMYKTVAEEKQDGGIWNKSTYIIDVKEDYEPQLTFRVALKHIARNKLKVRSGISTDTTDLWPEHIHEFDIFNYQGGENYMQGNNTYEEQKTIEFGLDVTPLLSHVIPGQPAKFFLQIHEFDPDGSAAGKILNFSLVDYANGVVEISCPDNNVGIISNGFTNLAVIHTLNPDYVSIETDELPAFTPDQTFNFQMQATGGSPPYDWNILTLYNESQFNGEFPSVEDELLNQQSLVSSGRVVQEIEFDFPFYGESYSELTIHAQGIIGFRDEKLPIPYQVDPQYLFRYAPYISPFYNRNLAFKPSQNSDNIWYSGNQNFAAFRWDVTLETEDSEFDVEFCTVLYPNGNIEYYYKDFEDITESEWLTGISEGDGTNYQISEYSQTLAKGIDIIKYMPQNSLSSYQMTSEGLLTAEPTDDETIYNLSVKVSDDNWISSTRHYQLSSGLIYNYTINSGGDNQVDYGETATLDLSVKNISSSTINSTVFTTSSDDPYVTFNDYAENIGAIGPGETLFFPDAISFTVSSLVPDNYYLPFDVLITSAIKSWTGQFSVKANAPNIRMGTPYVINTEQGWLNPGETGNIVIPVMNIGNALVSDVSGTILTDSPYITLNSAPTTYIGDLATGTTFHDTINITIHENCPQGIEVDFNYKIEASPNIINVEAFDLVIGRYPVLLIDMDPELFSGPIIRNTLDELDVIYRYENYIPDDFAQYQNLIVVLGRKYNNYVLTDADGQQLTNFLLTYGNIYMEGGETWSEDPATPVHAMFNIDVETNTWTAINPIQGVNGTFTEDMEFDFAGAIQVYNNHLIPIEPAYSILKKVENDDILAVAYDEGTYKTVGSNIDFGGLVDEEHPSTKRNLLAKILIFFDQDIVITDMVDATIYNEHKLNCYPNPFTGYSNISFHLQKNDNVDLSIYNINGQKVANVISQDNLPAGTHNYKLDGITLPSGVYHIILTTKATKSNIKLVIIN